MIDNIDQLSKLCVFEETHSCFYKFSALLRDKDFKDKLLPLKLNNKKDVLIKDWFIENADQLEKALYDMKVFSDMFNCRIYMALDRKNKKKTLMQIRNKVNMYLDMYLDREPSIGIKSISKIVSSSSSVSDSSDAGYKRWMFDIDSKDEGIVTAIEYLCGDELIATLPTLNGYHVIANKTFHPNDRGFTQVLDNTDCVELKTNAMTLILKK